MTTLQLDQLRKRAKAGEPESQFQLSQICFKNRDLEGMLRWLNLASKSGFANAEEALGVCYENGRGVSRNFDDAITHYDRALANGSDRAAYRKAELLYKSHRGPTHELAIRDLLLNAANSNSRVNVVPAQRVLGYLALQNESAGDLARNCLRRAAEGGDPVSSFNLGWHLLQQSDDDKARAEAAHWIGRAAVASYPYAKNLLSTLRDERVATPAPPAREKEIQLPEQFTLYPTSRNVEHREINVEPSIKLFNKVLDVMDCAYLMFLSHPHLTRADVIDPHGSKEGKISNVRTNMSTYLPYGIVDIIARYIELKIVSATDEDLSHSEPMSILFYSPGERYQPHVDYFDPDLSVSKELLKDGGQRTASAVTYLAAPLAGGGTSFPELGIQVPAMAGSSLWFRNCLVDGQPDPRSLHAGDPIKRGEKWVVTKWFREKPTHYLEF